MLKRVQVVFGVLFFALLFVYAGARIFRTLHSVQNLSDPGWAARQVGNRGLVEQTRAPGPASVLRQGDEIVAINGHDVKGNAAAAAVTAQQVRPETPYTIVIVRDGESREFTLTTKPFAFSILLLIQIANVAIPTIFLITGFGVFLLRPFDKQALLLALMFGMFIGAPLAVFGTYPPAGLMMTAVMLAAHLVSIFFWPVFFHFFLIFPEPSPLIRRFPGIEWGLYIPHLLTIFPYLAVLNVLSAFAPDKAATFRDRLSPYAGAIYVLFILYIAGGLMSLLVNYHEAGKPARRKMRVLVAGSIAGFFPFLVVFGTAFFFGVSTSSPSFFQWLVFLAVVAFPLFPLSFAYAIVRHQVIPVRIILRRSVRYLLVSRGFIIVQAIVVFAVLSFILTGDRIEAIDRLGDRADIIATMVATAIAIGLLTLLNQRVMPIIDRRFFREAYNAQQVLTELGREMRTVKNVDHLLELAVAKIQAALHSRNVTIFLRDQSSGDYTCGISSRLTEDGSRIGAAASGLSLSARGTIVERLSESLVPLNVDREGSGRWTGGAAAAGSTLGSESGRDRQALVSIESSLLLPVATKDDLVAVVSLGRRLGDLPFSGDDKQLLMAVAVQMAFAIQNAELVRQISDEDRLRHELEIATSVQRRLFPQGAPEMDSLELFGTCHPARGVGGDYYDFIVVGPGKIGVAVADVAGKGISAALLMSTIQASLRSQAPAVNGRLTELVSSMNELLHGATEANSFASFFYAQFDEVTRLLTYVNAGHNPPILLRGTAPMAAQAAKKAIAASYDFPITAEPETLNDQPARTTLLCTGGPVIGAFQRRAYEQEAIELESGDVLVAYTDGVTEAQNPAGEEFGETRLQQLTASLSHLPANELSDSIVSAVRDWRREAPQHDDLTLVVMRVK